MCLILSRQFSKLLSIVSLTSKGMPPPNRRMKQQVTGKVGQPVKEQAAPVPPGSYPPYSNNQDPRGARSGGGPSSVFPMLQPELDVPMQNDVVSNRVRARGALSGALGTYMTEPNESPHDHLTSKALKRKQASAAWASQSGDRERQKEPPTVPPPPPKYKAIGPAAGNVGLPKSMGVGEVDYNLIEIVYRNNAESQRCYLDFNPY